jgi:hypothetical protein
VLTHRAAVSLAESTCYLSQFLQQYGFLAKARGRIHGHIFQKMAGHFKGTQALFFLAPILISLLFYG